MRFTKLITYISIFIIALGLFSCRSKFNKVRKKGTYDEKYGAAVRYYEKKDYYHANILFEGLVPLSNGRKQAAEVQLYYAYCQYYQKQYIMASYHFKKFFETYPRDENVPDAMYMRAMSLYKLSPRYSLDQESTSKSVTAFQNYINKYPQSKHALEVNTKIDELQEKLELKTYKNTKLYVKIGYYKAAVIAIENFRLDFPDSHYNEELQFLKIQVQTDLAKKSLDLVEEDGEIINLKRNRYKKAQQFYYNFIDSYPYSKYTKDAEGLFKSIEQELNQKG